MDYKLIGALIVIISSVNCIQISETEESYVGFHKRITRQAPAKKCFALDRPQTKYSELHEFGTTFAKMVAGLQQVKTSSSGDVIMFVGNTGVGKSCLVHLLAGDTAHFTAVEDSPGTNNFYIIDTTGSHVSTATIKSTTTYPEAIKDAQSGVVFFDTPGFRDTRSAIHEVIAAYGLQGIAKSSKRLKFALLVNYDSLTTSGSRDDFINTVQSFFSLLHNPDKYRLATHLVATKVNNDYIVKKGQALPVSDDTFVSAIVRFLENVKQTLENNESEGTNYFTKQFSSLAKYFIGDLVNSRSRISLFRKPEEEGPVMNSTSIRRSVEKIRQSLLDSDGYVNAGANDFGFALSDKAKNYIRDLFDLMNNYTMDVSKSFTQSFEPFLVSKYKNSADITDITTGLQQMKRDVSVLIHSANVSHHPEEFANALQKFLHGVGADICNNETFKEINLLNSSLSNLQGVTKKNFYSPDKWAASLYEIERIVKNEQDYYVMLNNLFNKVTDHAALNDDFYIGISNVLRKHNKKTKVVDKHNFEHLMRHLALNQFAGLKMNEDRLNEINSIYFKAKEQYERQTHFCKNNTLVILGNFLQLQTLDRNKICADVTTVVLLATNRIYIDTNLGVDVLGGRNLVIIAPEWHVMGKFVISVDGPSQGAAPHKASYGEVGVDGKPGQSAGKFVGVALRYHNSEQLTITANGGRGQNGQDGGDGQDGQDGHDGTEERKIDESSNIYVIVNKFKSTSLIQAEKGSSGGDAGVGGVGGAGGFSGSIEMHSLTAQLPDHSIHETVDGAGGENGKNGVPGRGGLRGCDTIIKAYESRFLFIPVGSSKQQEMVNCVRKNANGQLVSNEAKYSETPSRVPAPPSICELYGKMADRFEPDMFSSKVFEEFQLNFNKKFNCKV